MNCVKSFNFFIIAVLFCANGAYAAAPALKGILKKSAPAQSTPNDALFEMFKSRADERTEEQLGKGAHPDLFKSVRVLHLSDIVSEHLENPEQREKNEREIHDAAEQKNRDTFKSIKHRANVCTRAELGANVHPDIFKAVRAMYVDHFTTAAISATNPRKVRFAQFEE